MKNFSNRFCLKNRVVWVLKALWIVWSTTINILRKLHTFSGYPQKSYHSFMYIAPSSGHGLMKLYLTSRLIWGDLRLFSDVWSENAAFSERLKEIHSNPQYYTTCMALNQFTFLYGTCQKLSVCPLVHVNCFIWLSVLVCFDSKLAHISRCTPTPAQTRRTVWCRLGNADKVVNALRELENLVLSVSFLLAWNLTNSTNVNFIDHLLHICMLRLLN